MEDAGRGQAAGPLQNTMHFQINVADLFWGFLNHSFMEIRVLLSTVATTAVVGGKCCMQTQRTTAPGWQANHLSSFQPGNGSAFEPPTALNPASPVNYEHLCPAAQGSWNGKDTQSTASWMRLHAAYRNGKVFLSTMASDGGGCCSPFPCLGCSTHQVPWRMGFSVQAG